MLEDKSLLVKAHSALKQGRFRNSLRSYLLQKFSRIITYCLATLCRDENIARYLSYRVGQFGFFLRGTYFVTNNAGLLSCASTTLSDLCEYDLPVSKINSRFGMSLYKRSLFENNWSSFFEQPERPEDKKPNPTFAPFSLPVHEWWSARYASLPVISMKPALARFFRPAVVIQELSHRLVADCDIDFGQTIGVHYRGTDKFKEAKIPPVQAFIKKTSMALENMPSAKVFLLTDEQNALSLFTRDFKERLVFNQSLRAPEGELGAHNVDSRDGQRQGQIFLANLLLISKCQTLITHTGNGALWEVLYRGSLDGVIQLH